ncbi:CHAD domain-containing protein [Granulicella sp. S156]|uniref:CHAD domain-containing protein n=1 Tax=Granulicella sp. S156 TaxID=1747224 RepID=UPI00131C1743|nr:CHAD domain-containing protein [Granulicella sp. S156]
MANPTTSPVRTLREHTLALQEAMTVCLSKPRPRAVHKVRTEAGRIEAQLELLNLLKKLPSHRSETARVLRLLKKIRRAAGRVRDLDVQRKLLKPPVANNPEDPATEDAEQQTPHSASELSESADLTELRQIRKRRRKRAARKLLKLLDKRQKKLAAAFDALLTALEPVQDLQLPAAELLQLIDQRFRGTHALIIRHPSSEHLHSIRKAARVARYQAEIAPDSAAAIRAAQRYEALQVAGGQWHDTLSLAADAATELGDNHAAAVSFGQQRDQHLAAYRALLERVRP